MGTWKQVALAVAAIVVIAAPAGAESTRIGYVNLQQVIGGSKAGQKAQADMKVEVEKLEKKLTAKKDELLKMKEDLERRAVVMREEERRKLAEDFERKQLDLKLEFEETQAELQKKDQELTGTILGRLREIIGEIGKQKGYGLVLELGSPMVLYYDPADDISAEVLKAFDASS